MGWRRLFGVEEPSAAPPARPAPALFAVERDRMFDLSLTDRLHHLFAAPPGTRDEAWTAAFFAAVWNASLEIADPPVFEGPDGFVYARLQLPRPAGPFEANALSNQAAMLVERGFGAAIFPTPDAAEPAYVLPMGVLDSLLRFDGWTGDPLDRRAAADAPDPAFVPEGGAPGRLIATRDHEVMIGAPSAEFLPPHVARALHRHLTGGWGIADPRVALLVDPAADAPRSLMIDRRVEDFADPATIEPRVRMLLWYLPPSSSILLRPDTVAIGRMTPLRDLFPADPA